MLAPPVEASKLVNILFVPPISIGAVILLLIKLFAIVVDAELIINGVVGVPAPSLVLNKYLLLLIFTEIKPKSVADIYD